jgi:PAS domain-containing protein
VNYTLQGERLDVQLHGRVLPGYEESWKRVMISIEDVTERESARRRLAVSENYAFGLFAHSPVSLWVEDFSGVKRLIDEVRAQGVEDFRVFTDVHVEFVERCMSEIRVLDVNARTLDLFGAPDKQTLLLSLSDIFRDEMGPHFREQLIDLWEGRLFQQREVVNYALDGTKLHLLLQFSVLPGHERDWSQVQVALTDITARKKAEAYLEFLGTHDVLTRIYNRAFFVDELNRMERRRKSSHPVTIIVADLNGLKAANDQ